MSHSGFFKFKEGAKLKHIGKTDQPETSFMGSLFRSTVPEKTMRRFKVCQCKDCGRIQVTEAKKLSCSYCGASSVFRTRHRWNLKLIQTDDFEIANRLCRHWSDCLGHDVSDLKEIVALFIDLK